MCDSVAVHIVDASGDLMSYVPCTVLRDLELPSVEVLEEITARAVLKHNVDVLRILKNIDHPYDVRVLADLEHLNLSFLQLELFQSYVHLLYDLDGHLPL